MDSRRPLFFNCWSRNILCHFQTPEGARWFAALGRHGRNFPIYGSSYDSLMLVQAETRLGYGRIAEEISHLSFRREGDLLSVEFEGELGVYPAGHGTFGSVPVKLALHFHATPTGREKVFLKRFLSLGSRFLPGAIFDNQMLSGAANQLNYIQVAGTYSPVIPLGIRGHLESGQLSLLSPRPWSLCYRYIGMVGEEFSPFPFCCEWDLLPWKKGSWGYRAASWVKGRLHRSAYICRDLQGNIRKALGKPEGLPAAGPQHELFALTHPLGEFSFSRAFLRVPDSLGKTWWGIREDFSHPELLSENRRIHAASAPADPTVSSRSV